MKAYQIKADGTAGVIHILDNSLPEMQKLVGGYIECVRISQSLVMIVNEEGLVYHLPYNEKASKFYAGPIVGDTFIVRQGREYFNGVRPDDVRWIENVLE